MFICTYTFCFIGKKEKNLATINVILLYKRSVKKIAFTINVILHMLICMCWAPVPECGSWVEPAKFPIGLTLHASCFGAYQYPSSHHFLLKESRFFFKKKRRVTTFYFITCLSVSRIGWKVIVRVLYIFLGSNIP